MTRPLRSTRLHSKSVVKCGDCEKVIKDDDTSAIGCSSSGKWVNGSCAGISDMEVIWFGTKSFVVRLTDTCVKANKICATPTTESKLTSILETFAGELESNISNLLVQLIKKTLPEMNENVKEAVSKSLPSYSDICVVIKKMITPPNCNLFSLAYPELRQPTSSNSTDTTEVENIVQHMHLQSENNITAIPRLARVLKAKVDETGQESRARCHPLLITTSNSRFLNSCFVRSLYLQNNPARVYVKKFLSQGDRGLKKELLSKRYEIVTTDGRVRKDFRIKILKLYYKNELLEISTQCLCPRKCYWSTVNLFVPSKNATR